MKVVEEGQNNMANSKRWDGFKGMLPFIIGQFVGMNAPRMLVVSAQIDVGRLVQSVNGSTAFGVASKRIIHPITAAQAAQLFCISGGSPQPLCFTDADLAQLPRTSLTVPDSRDGNRVVYEGVLLREVLTRAGVPQGEQLRGANLARYLVVEGADGYRVVFGLPEFDPAFGNRVVLLADRRDGHALAADEAPLRLVIPDDQRRARWVRKITRIRVMQSRVTP